MCMFLWHTHIQTLTQTQLLTGLVLGSLAFWCFMFNFSAPWWRCCLCLYQSIQVSWQAYLRSCRYANQLIIYSLACTSVYFIYYTGKSFSTKALVGFCFGILLVVIIDLIVTVLGSALLTENGLRNGKCIFFWLVIRSSRNIMVVFIDVYCLIARNWTQQWH